MIVRYRRPDMSKCPDNIKPYIQGAVAGDHKHEDYQDEYRVLAVATHEGFSSYLVFNDNFPHWIPCWMFTVKDGFIPNHWVCNSFPDWPDLVIGPPFIAGSKEAYARSLDPETDMKRLLRRELEAAESENYYIGSCSVCEEYGIAIAVILKDGSIAAQCHECGSRYDDPRAIGKEGAGTFDHLWNDILRPASFEDIRLNGWDTLVNWKLSRTNHFGDLKNR